MIDARRLLADLQKLLKQLEADIRQRIDEQPVVIRELQAEWQQARDSKRISRTFFDWLEDAVTQAGVHWILATVFLRFLEDNGYLERPFLFGSAANSQALARDRHEVYFRANPSHSDREYLLASFAEASQLPGLKGLFDLRHNPLFRLGVSGDGAMALLGFWRKIDPDTGHVIHGFEHPEHETRFLGDLYQDLSEAARKRYALLQTPEFIEEFILDRTLTPAIEAFGYKVVRLLDPTCGSGHFLLGAFVRLVALWARHEPARNLPDLVQRALDGVYGVDLNPFAAEIARFRLLIAALKESGIRKLRDAPDFQINVAIGDSLLHGRRIGQLDLGEEARSLLTTGLAHAYRTEDLDEINRILDQQYHAVVGNPPYITVKDAVLSQAYRARYSTCHMKYSLGVPFTQRFFQLSLSGNDSDPAGFVGLITTNSFMKREFGSKLIEEYLPRVNLTHVIDTSVASIPGHGTPTVILFGRNGSPRGDTVRTVMGIKGEPSPPEIPAQGKVWRAIVEQVDSVGSESAFISVGDTPRTTFGKHPWSIGGGGAAELKEQIEEDRQPLSTLNVSIGFSAITGEDDAFVLPEDAMRRLRAPARPFGVGDEVRDWAHKSRSEVIFPYADEQGALTAHLPVKAVALTEHLWCLRTKLRNRLMFGKTPEQAGLAWWELSFVSEERLRAPFLITFAFVATNNHFALNRGGTVFNRSAPVIRLPRGTDQDTHLGLLGLLNSSTAGFWMQQVFHNKGGPGGGSSKDEKWHDFYEHAGTKLADFPLIASYPTELARQLDSLAQAYVAHWPESVIASAPPTRNALDGARANAESTLQRMVTLQEELDWRTYLLYGLVDEDLEYSAPPPIRPGERAFEIVLARRIAAGESETKWFQWLNVRPITDPPAEWPADYRHIVERRIALIESDRNIALIEAPSSKRRWERESWDEKENRALTTWLLGRLETDHFWGGPPALKSVNRLADLARSDTEFIQVATLYYGRDDFDVAALVATLVTGEAVPFLPVLRFAESGLRKREEWAHTWQLQRQEDEIDAEMEAGSSERRHRLESVVRDTRTAANLDAETHQWIETTLRAEMAAESNQRKAAEIGKIPVPPKYQSKDFLKPDLWRLRGGLDVPKERFVSYPGASPDADGSLQVAWAGWTHLQQATALAGHYVALKDQEGWPPARLAPLLTGLLELIPWLKQWHNQYDPVYGTGLGDYFDGFVQGEARALGFTTDALRVWQPAAFSSNKPSRRKKIG